MQVIEGLHFDGSAYLSGKTSSPDVALRELAALDSSIARLAIRVGPHAPVIVAANAVDAAAWKLVAPEESLGALPDKTLAGFKDFGNARRQFTVAANQLARVALPPTNDAEIHRSADSP
jgi:hypothetical protein